MEPTLKHATAAVFGAAPGRSPARRKTNKGGTIRALAACTMLPALFFSGTAISAADPPDSVIELPAGVACEFPLRVEIRGGPQVQREFKDKNGNVVRTLSAGRGSALTFFNLTTNATLALKPNGSVTHVTNNPDGTSTWVTTGHNVLILFPTDVPPGPTTTLYVGRVTFTVDNVTGIFTLGKTSGQASDICAALSL